MKILKKLLVTLLTTFAFIYMSYILINQQTKLNDLNGEIAFYNREIEEQNLKTENLTNTIASMSTDEYMEEVARDKLGLVMPSEIIFMDASI